MSADNYQLIAKEKDKYVLYEGCASNDFRSKVGAYNTIEEAIKVSQESYTEYGLSFDLEDKAEK